MSPHFFKDRGDEDYPGSSCKPLLWRWALVLEQETCGHANHYGGERWGLGGRSGKGMWCNWSNMLTWIFQIYLFCLELGLKWSWISLFFLQLCKAEQDLLFFGGEYAHLVSWRELDDKIVTSSWVPYLSNETQNRTRDRSTFFEIRLFVFLPVVLSEDWNDLFLVKQSCLTA